VKKSWEIPILLSHMRGVPCPKKVVFTRRNVQPAPSSGPKFEIKVTLQNLNATTVLNEKTFPKGLTLKAGVIFVPENCSAN